MMHPTLRYCYNGDEVTCYSCAEVFTINKDTLVQEMDTELDDGTMIYLVQAYCSCGCFTDV